MAAHDPAFRQRFDLDDAEMLVRSPRDFPPEFEYNEDLKRKNFVAFRQIEDAVMLGPKLRQTLVKDLNALAPFVDYLCAALDLKF